MTDMLAEARRILKTVFGYDDFLPVQAKVIQHVLHFRDTLAIMPTGSEKIAYTANPIKEEE